MSQENTVKAFIGLGSNLGDGKALLQGAWQALGNIGGIVLDGLSSPYMTAPVDMTSQHWFTNGVGRIQVSLSPLELLEVLLDVEASFGRTRKEKTFVHQDRSLDLDLLYYGDVLMDSPELTLPHPRIADRLFVLVPFAELEPDFKDNISEKSISSMELHLRGQMAPLKSKKQEIIKGAWSE
ncbi:MAG: 2-amino-4-hydroxy-6-hydroxymethyldihydropteridine diphosphokinase [Desulfobulbaceae bacterium]|nr:2-amino-4-hydroxy-6-hydroxymethyldihydropteridine diphosphokinase [Desulfobulbaceae bacterium]